MYKPTVLLALACLAVPVLGAPIYVVAPNNRASTVGNAQDDITHDTRNGRFQEDVGIGQFSAFDGPISITQMTFRAAPGTGAVNFPISNLDLYLSTSPFFPNENNGATLISTTFDDNVGGEAHFAVLV